ncbi:MAG: DEAD/DEAH box helicase [Bacteroidota bacterium]
MTTFKDLNLSKQLINALTDIGFDRPTPIQEKAFPIIMSGKDVVGIAQTGTGKTFAYLLPILRQLTYSEQRQPRILIVVPTRELVMQVVNEIEKLSKYMTVRFTGVFGGGNINIQKQKVYNGLDILVATPGRLIDLTLSRTLQFKGIQKLVIDEVDEMLNLGFRTQIIQILDILPEKRQNLMFSATLNEDVETMIENYFTKPVYVELITRGTPLEKIIQNVYHVPNFFTKINLLENLLVTEKEFRKVLVFVKNKKIADDIFKSLETKFGLEIGVIHSNKTQPQRFDAVKKFDEGIHKLLIATDVIARGLDLKDVTHVLNFDMPLKDPNSYIHRIGRTGRSDKTGVSISFVTKTDIEILKAIEELMNKKMTVLELPSSVEISTDLTQDEKPVTREKNLNKNKKLIKPTGAFHEKLDKNKKINLGGARKRENQKRIAERKSKKQY